MALAVCTASDFTSEATTAKPLPASPARAASMVALSASRLVCSAMSRISPITSPIFPATSASPAICVLVVSASLVATAATSTVCASSRLISPIERDSSSAAVAAVSTLRAPSLEVSIACSTRREVAFAESNSCEAVDLSTFELSPTVRVTTWMRSRKRPISASTSWRRRSCCEQRVALAVGEPRALGLGRQRLGAGRLRLLERRDRAVGQVGERHDLHDHDHRMDHDARKVRAVGKHRIGVDEIQHEMMHRDGRARDQDREPAAPHRDHGERGEERHVHVDLVAAAGVLQHQQRDDARERRGRDVAREVADRIAHPQHGGDAAQREPERKRRDQGRAAHRRERADAGGQGPQQGDQHLAEGEAELEKSGAHSEAPAARWPRSTGKQAVTSVASRTSSAPAR